MPQSMAEVSNRVTLAPLATHESVAKLIGARDGEIAASPPERTARIDTPEAPTELEEMSAHTLRLELHCQRMADGKFGIFLNDDNQVTGVADGSPLQRQDTVIAVDGTSIIGQKLCDNTPAADEMVLTVLRLKEAATPKKSRKPLLKLPTSVLAPRMKRNAVRPEPLRLAVVEGSGALRQARRREKASWRKSSVAPYTPSPSASGGMSTGLTPALDAAALAPSEAELADQLMAASADAAVPTSPAA